MIDNTTLYKTLYTSTAIGRRVYEIGERCEARNLFAVYMNPSEYKRRAYESCYREFVADRDAHNFRIASHNHQYFTVAWDTSCIDPKTGAIEKCRVIDTGRNRYLVIEV